MKIRTICEVVLVAVAAAAVYVAVVPGEKAIKPNCYN